MNYSLTPARMYLAPFSNSFISIYLQLFYFHVYYIYFFRPSSNITFIFLLTLKEPFRFSRRRSRIYLPKRTKRTLCRNIFIWKKKWFQIISQDHFVVGPAYVSTVKLHLTVSYWRSAKRAPLAVFHQNEHFRCPPIDRLHRTTYSCGILRYV